MTLEQEFKEHDKKDDTRFAELITGTNKFHNEISGRLQEISYEMKENTKDIKEIKEQTTMTNGRVNGHDKFVWALTGMGMVIVIILVPLLLNLLKK